MKVYYSQDTKPVNSIARRREPAVIPPFSFVGRLRQGRSPGWSPPHSLYLSGVTMTATSDGTSDAVIIVYKIEPSLIAQEEGEPVSIFQFRFINGQRRMSFRIASPLSQGQEDEGILVTPYDQLYIYCDNNSSHENVCIQFIGWKAYQTQ